MRLRTRLVILATVCATLVLTFLTLNLSMGNKQVDTRFERRYGATEAQFPRAMGAVLSPPLVAGNRVEELLNGEQIFPAMLGAIKSAQESITLETYGMEIPEA